MNSQNFARALFVVPFVAVLACGSSNGTGATTSETTGVGGTTSGPGSSSSAGNGGSKTGSTSASGAGASGGATTTTGSTSGSTTGSTTTTTTTTAASSSSGGAAGACTDATDKGVNMTTVGNDASGCVTGGNGCLGDYLSSNFTALATCVAGCLQTMDAPLTAPCAACWGTVVACGAQHCASECGPGGTTASCNTCTDQFCTPAFNTCAGM